jgi:hypothetical protein
MSERIEKEIVYHTEGARVRVKISKMRKIDTGAKYPGEDVVEAELETNHRTNDEAKSQLDVSLKELSQKLGVKLEAT